MTFSGQVEAGYAASAAALIAQYDAVPSDILYAHVRDLFPPEPVRVLDVGSGNGRDAEWCATLGYDVTAVDPVAAFVAETMQRAPSATILRDRLPALRTVRGRYNLILVNAVWQHIETDDRPSAMCRLSELLSEDGRLVLALRHGPGHRARPVLGIHADETCQQAEASGLHLLRRCARKSMQTLNQAHGVTWTWLAFGKDRHS